MKVAVVGAGIMGAASAWALAQRGHEVVVYEQFAGTPTRGSSHGRSRIVRRAYPDVFYTEIMTEAYPLWEQICPPVEGGLLYFGPEENPNVQSVIAGLEAHAIPFEIWREAPGIRLQPGEIGVFTPGAGWVAADRARAAFLAGIEVRVQRVKDPAELNADAVILAPGPWIDRFVPGVSVAPHLQTFAYVENAPDYPYVWIEEGPHYLYGFPSESAGESRIKFGVHRPGIPLDPDDPAREPEAAALELLKDFARRRLGIREPELTEATACIYTNTPDEDFRWGELASGVFWVSACSGHGFKFAPWIGERMADFAEGKRAPAEWPRFARL